MEEAEERHPLEEEVEGVLQLMASVVAAAAEPKGHYFQAWEVVAEEHRARHCRASAAEEEEVVEKIPELRHRRWVPEEQEEVY